MERFVNYLKENAVGVTILLTMLTAGLGLSLASGCTLSDLVKVNVPTSVREVTNAQKKVTLTEAPYVRQRYIAEITTSLDQFDRSIEQASAFRDLTASLLNTGIGAAEGALAGVPGGAFLIGALGGLGGLFLKKPGTDALVNAEKRASFNAGLKKAVTSAT